ncbi:protein containing Glycosyl hydrolase 67, partial [human gut metagenome]
ARLPCNGAACFYTLAELKALAPDGLMLSNGPGDPAENVQVIVTRHFEGVNEVEEMIVSWKAWKEEMAEDVYERVLSRMERQLSNAIEWRDRVNTYFYRKSGVKDALSRKIYE